MKIILINNNNNNNIREPFSSGPEKNLNKWTKEQEN